MNVALVVNPNKVGDLRQARAAVEARAAAWGAPPPVWLETTRAEPGGPQARRAVEGGATVVLAWGGDGTVMAVAAELAHTDVALGILPGGTGNLLARNLGVPLTIWDALEVAYRGVDRRIDLLDVYLGRGERQLCAVMCGTGWDAAMMAAPEALKKTLGWGAYAIEGARRARQQPMRLRLSIDGGPEQHLYGRTVLIANVGTLVAGLELLPESEADDGLLEVLVIDPSSPLDWLRTTAGIVRGAGSAGDPSRTLYRGTDVVVTTGHARKRQIDGELVSDGYGFHVRVLPAALTVRVPAVTPAR
jgi:diacylglycerol kinase family enzyme